MTKHSSTTVVVVAAMMVIVVVPMVVMMVRTVKKKVLLPQKKKSFSKIQAANSTTLRQYIKVHIIQFELSKFPKQNNSSEAPPYQRGPTII